MMKLTHLFAAGLLLTALQSAAHRIEYYTANGCVIPGSPLVVDAKVVYAPNTTQYRWQYKTATGNWTCFDNGNNTINSTVFSVTNVSGTGANNAPALTISNPGSALDNVQLRCLMREGASPCNAPPGTTYGGDDLALSEVKTLRLKYNANSGTCNISCADNLLTGSNGYYGGFESVTYDATTESFTDRNFDAGAGATDYTNAGSGTGVYRVRNNPLSAYSGLTNARFAPHGGNYQMIVKGNTTASARVWYKTLTVQPGEVYSFSAWAAKVDGTAPRIQLKANNTQLAATLLSSATGAWTQLNGTYAVPPGVTSVTFAIHDKDAGSGAHNYVLDDICLVKTSAPITIGDKVWHDVNKNGRQDASEPGVGGVTVKLFYDNNGDNVADSANATYTATTNSSGIYSFTGVIPGKYFVQFTLPAGYSAFTQQDASGVPVGENSTANVNTGKTGTHNFTSNYYYKDAGLVKLSDLTPVITVAPATLYGNASFVNRVDIWNLGPAASSGLITVYLTKSTLLSYTMNPLTTTMLGAPVQNNEWTLDATSNASYYIFTSTRAVSAGSKISFGLNGSINPGSTQGQLNNTAIIGSGSGGESNGANNTDADVIIYFQN